jgi:restriction endonuclease S subunit
MAFQEIKNVCLVNNETLGDKTPDDYLIEYVDIGNTNDKGEFLEVQEIEFSEAPSRARRKVENGDTIISTVRTYLRAIAFIEQPKENLIVSTGFAVLNPIKRILQPKFLFYQVLCDSFIQRVIANSEGVSYPAISSTKLADVKLFIPSVKEQLAIANYLDSETKKIDRLIANKKAQAEKLKELRQIEINAAVTKGLNPKVELKYSGVEWLGKIPKHWEVKRLKNVADVKYGLGQPPEEKEDGLPLIRATNVERGKINETDLIYVDPLDVPYDRDPVLMANDIIVVRSGAYTADSAIIPKKFEGAIAGYDMVMRVIKSSPLFISYCLLSNYLLVNQLFLERLRAAQPHLNKEELSKALVIIPPKNEQVQIANYLHDRTETIDRLLKNIELQIEKLQELRKIKIYEAVTGKIKVSLQNS